MNRSASSNKGGGPNKGGPPCHFLHHESLQFFSYFVLLSLFFLFLGLSFLVFLSSTRYITDAFTLACGHPGLGRKILYSIEYCTIKYTKAWLLVEDARMWQCKPDKWTNSQDWTSECMLAFLKVLQLEDSYVDLLCAGATSFPFSSLCSWGHSHSLTFAFVLTSARICLSPHISKTFSLISFRFLLKCHCLDRPSLTTLYHIALPAYSPVSLIPLILFLFFAINLLPLFLTIYKYIYVQLFIAYFSLLELRF